MSVQRSELYSFSAVDVFLELLKRRICYYTKKVQQGDGCDNMTASNDKFSLRLIRSKLRKREESSGVHRTNVVHPEGVLQALQATVINTGPEPQQDTNKSSPLEEIFITPVSNRSSLTCSVSGSSLSSYESSVSVEPMFLYSTGNSRNSLNSNDQRTLVHPSGPAEDLENNNNSNHNHNNNNNNNNNNHTKKNIKRKIRKLLHKKSPPMENYALPFELREQLKQIYVY